MSKRPSVSRTERARLFNLHGGICHFCKGKIDGVRERWELSHVIERKLLEDDPERADSDENRQPAHYKCHRGYTYEEGNPMVARVERKRAKHLGIYPKSPFKLQGRGFQKWQPTPTE